MLIIDRSIDQPQIAGLAGRRHPSLVNIIHVISNVVHHFNTVFAEFLKKLTRGKIPIDKENGFYATVDYNYSTEKADIKLEDKPSLTPKDILEVKKVLSSYNDRPEISIVFTKEGAKKFMEYVLSEDFQNLVPQKNYMLNQYDFFKGDFLIGFNITRIYNF